LSSRILSYFHADNGRDKHVTFAIDMNFRLVDLREREGGEYNILQKVGNLRHQHPHCPWYYSCGFSIDVYIILFYCTLAWFMEIVKLTPVINYNLGRTRFLIEQK
jgi:hypothetical protein